MLLKRKISKDVFINGNSNLTYYSRQFNCMCHNFEYEETGRSGERYAATTARLIRINRVQSRHIKEKRAL